VREVSLIFVIRHSIFDKFTFYTTDRARQTQQILLWKHQLPGDKLSSRPRSTPYFHVRLLITMGWDWTKVTYLTIDALLENLCWSDYRRCKYLDVISSLATSMLCLILSVLRNLPSFFCTSCTILY